MFLYTLNLLRPPIGIMVRVFAKGPGEQVLFQVDS